MTENERAVIIGCYVNGASFEQISELLIYPIETVKNIIEEYEKENHKIKK